MQAMPIRDQNMQLALCTVIVIISRRSIQWFKYNSGHFRKVLLQQSLVQFNGRPILSLLLYRHSCTLHDQCWVTPSLYCWLATSHESIVKIVRVSYTTILTSTVAIVPTDIISFDAIKAYVALHWYWFEISDMFRIQDCMIYPILTHFHMYTMHKIYRLETTLSIWNMS